MANSVRHQNLALPESRIKNKWLFNTSYFLFRTTILFCGRSLPLSPCTISIPLMYGLPFAASPIRTITQSRTQLRIMLAVLVMSSPFQANIRN